MRDMVLKGKQRDVPGRGIPFRQTGGSVVGMEIPNHGDRFAFQQAFQMALVFLKKAQCPGPMQISTVLTDKGVLSARDAERVLEVGPCREYGSQANISSQRLWQRDKAARPAQHARRGFAMPVRLFSVHSRRSRRIGHEYGIIHPHQNIPIME